MTSYMFTAAEVEANSEFISDRNLCSDEFWIADHYE